MWNNINKQLKEVREEVEESCELDSDLDPIPDTAYQEAERLCEILHDYDAPIPEPDIGWLMDGGIGFEWRADNGRSIATISLYGDNQAIYGALLERGSRCSGTCTLSNLPVLTEFLKVLAAFSDRQAAINP